MAVRTRVQKVSITTEAKICLAVGLKLGKAIEEKYPV